MASKGVKDLLKLVSDHANIPGLDTVISAENIKDVEISDEDFTKMKDSVSGLMTVEAAVNNKDVIDKIKEEVTPEVQSQTLFSIEKRFKKLASKTGIDLGDAKKAHDQLDIFEKHLPSKIGTGDNQKLLDSLKEDNDKLSKSLDDQKEQYEQKITDLNTSFENKAIRSKFDLWANDKNWADPYKPVKSALTEDVWKKVTGQVILKEVDGELKPFNKEIPEKPHMIGNKKATLSDVADAFIEPFLRKSEAPEQPARQVTAPDFSDMNPAERRKAQLQLQADREAALAR